MYVAYVKSFCNGFSISSGTTAAALLVSEVSGGGAFFLSRDFATC